LYTEQYTRPAFCTVTVMSADTAIVLRNKKALVNSALAKTYRSWPPDGPPHHHKKIYSLYASTQTSTNMSPIQNAIKEIELHVPGASFLYCALAKKYDISRNTLAHKHRGLTDSYAGAASGRFLKKHSGLITNKYIKGIDCNRHKTDSYDKHQLYFELLHSKISKYNISPDQIYNMDEKGFLIRVLSKSKRVFSKAK
jgi:hypothetical protein